MIYPSLTPSDPSVFGFKKRQFIFVAFLPFFLILNLQGCENWLSMLFRAHSRVPRSSSELRVWIRVEAAPLDSTRWLGTWSSDPSWLWKVQIKDWCSGLELILHSNLRLESIAPSTVVVGVGKEQVGESKKIKFTIN